MIRASLNKLQKLEEKKTILDVKIIIIIIII